MNLYIRLENGQPVGHPILLENLLDAYPEIDPNNIPGIFVRFERVECPPLATYEISNGVTYEWVDDCVKDVWHVRTMTEEEKTALQNQIKDQWREYGYPSWIFDEDTCLFNAPVPRPDDGKKYTWDESSLSWVEILDL